MLNSGIITPVPNILLIKLKKSLLVLKIFMLWTQFAVCYVINSNAIALKSRRK